MNPIRVRRFDHRREDPAPLFALFASCYGDSRPWQRRWRWEYLEHPQSREIQLLVAEARGRIVATTSRMPLTLKLDDRTCRAAFCSNSMVHPDYRRRGLISALYRSNRSSCPLLLSRGTMPEMAEVLKRLGNVPIDTGRYYAALLAPWQWLAGKAGWRSERPPAPGRVRLDPAYAPLEGFDADCAALLDRVGGQASACVVKDSDFMVWRYGGTPGRYRIYGRRTAAGLAALLVVSLRGRTAFLVDLAWDREAADEPGRTLGFAMQWARGEGAVKLVAWGGGSAFRKELRSAGFRVCGEHHHFSYNALDGRSYRRLDECFFVHGDGDSEYLQE